MKQLAQFIACLLLPLSIYTQPFGNEWINYNQQYLKIPVTKKGMYKIEHGAVQAALSNIGVNLNSINPRNIQLFARGKEQPIEIAGGADGSFDPSDYILFYGEQNDGWFDKYLYQDSTKSRINPYYSLYSDTQYYFLTWNNLALNARFNTSTNTSFAGKIPQQYFFAQSVGYFTNSYNYGFKDDAGVSAPLFHPAEGYASPIISNPSVRFVDAITRNIYQSASAPNTTFRTTFAGASNATGIPNHRIEVSINNSPIFDSSFTGYELAEKTISINTASLSSVTQRTSFKNLPITPAPATDFIYAGYAFFEYPHSTNISSEPIIEMWVPESTDTLYYNLRNYSYGNIPFVYDLEMQLKCSTVQSGRDIEVLIPPGKKRKCIIVSPSRFTAITEIKPISTITNSRGYFIDYANLVSDSAFLMVSHQSLWSAATQYANYKTQKGFNVLLVNSEDLYDQFAYGIFQHGLAIKNFARFIENKKSTAPPQYLFLAGKSVKTISTRKNASNRSKNKVPTIGTPPADNLYTISLRGNETRPSFPVGRIAAATSTQLIDYLDKVKLHDNQQGNQPSGIEDAIWKKRGIHFAGGANDFEQRIFSNYLDQYSSIYESPKMAGVIHTYKRFNTGTSQSIGFDTVGLLLNEGVALLSFFGHGSNGQIGINLGEPSDYNNTGKFPLFIANSCNVGDYHLPNENAVSVNEKWMLTKNKGAIGFIASTSIGYPSNLNRFTRGFYNSMAQDYYGKSIGNMMQAAAAGMNPGLELDLRTALEMNLHGDPSLKLNPISKADFAIERKFIKAPEVLSAENVDIEITVYVYNLGQATDSIIDVQLDWRYSNGKDTSFIMQFRDRSYINEIKFNLPIDEDNAIGENVFSIHVNPNLTVDEIYPSENNIVNGVRVNITSDDLIPIWPKDFAIVPNEEITFAASTADLFAKEAEYVFELDINDQFNSTMKKTATITSKGGVLEWKPFISHAPDSVVYYWRCSPKKQKIADYKWRNRSFQIIPNEEGWSQYDFNQFSKNKFSSLNYDKPNQSFGFLNGSVSIAGSTKGYPQGAEYSNIIWSKNGDVQGRAGFCGGRPSMLIAVIDPNTLQPWETRYFDNSVTPPLEINANRNYGNYNDPAQSSCPTKDLKFMFRVDSPAEMDSMVSMINNHVPDSFYLLIMTGNRAYFRDTLRWKERHLKVFEDLGSDSIRTMVSDHPLILFAQKGNPSKTIEVVGTEPTAAISVSTSINARIGNGFMESTIIGPSKDFKRLSWSFSTNSSQDAMELKLSGIDSLGKVSEVSTLQSNEKTIENLTQAYPDISNYNYLQLTANFFDNTAFTAPQLNKLQLYFDESPEFALDPGALFKFHNDTVVQGETVVLQTEVKNASRIAASNLKVRSYLRSENNEIIDLPIKTIAKLNPWQGLNDSFLVNTTQLSGMYTLTIELNPLDTNWQPEAVYFNNLIQKSFYVKADNLNPLLDVTFDGVHILDGDIVSARPEIRMSLNDENIFLPLNDTANFEVYLTYPDKSQQRVYFIENGTENLRFESATDAKNTATIKYNPTLKTDGVYKLSVNATDGSGNRSGDQNFEITFEVINRSTITRVMNYPNPFTTRTQFVFTLTGYKIPEQFRIQILSITGKVVREIDKYELGHIHIGRNITDYAWDGTDEFGDRLANGVYFYRVLTKIEGDKVEHRTSGADSYFKKEFGKMYLMR